MNILLIAALLPVIALGYYIYIKDTHTEPTGLLLKIFGMGCLIVIPVLILEIILGHYFPTEGVPNFMKVFINTFISVAIVEEAFKWIVTKKYGYNSDSFDEIYDIIVYAVFASLGFAAVENVLYVFGGGLATAFVRALLSIPGHTCFGVLMGYYLAKAKINSNSGNYLLHNKNMILSLLLPAIGHTIYDAILLHSNNIKSNEYMVYFYLFFIVLVVVCFIIVKRLSKMQQNLTTGVKEGTIVVPKNGNIEIGNTNIDNCPICGKYVKGFDYCPYCGIKLKK